jgi:nicotinamide-nucleotide amidase
VTISTTGEERDRTRIELIAKLARATDTSIAVAESLTAGNISTRLGQGDDAAAWFRGAVVAYAAEVKFEVLGVTPGPVVTVSCAHQMARGVRTLLQADIGLAITGVGGPGPEEGSPPGTVHLAVATATGLSSRSLHLPGDPAEVVAAATSVALEALATALDRPLA